MRRLVAIFACLITVNVTAFIDNRFFIPYISNDPYFLSPEEPSYMRVHTFAGSADTAYGGSGNELPLFEFAWDAGMHQYEQVNLDQALRQSDRIETSLLPSEWRSAEVFSPWRMAGHIEMQGFDISAYYPVSSWLTLGGSWYFMFVSSRLDLLRELDPRREAALQQPGNNQKVFDIKAQTHDALGVRPSLFIETEPGDLDLFARFSWSREYAYKFQYLDLGVQAGLLLPTSEQRDIDNPASVPVGGNNHAGIYVSFNPHAILKDNVRAGWDLRVTKRFSTEQRQRMPVADEPILFGAAVGSAEIDPGVTVSFAPYLALEELRDGFGLLFRYAVVGHDKDQWRNIKVPRTIEQVDVDTLRQTSSWALEHVTAEAFYDFGNDETADQPSARLIIKGEAPVEWLAARRSAKMYGFSLAFEGKF